jgi:hypothetical protein
VHRADIDRDDLTLYFNADNIVVPFSKLDIVRTDHVKGQLNFGAEAQQVSLPEEAQKMISDVQDKLTMLYQDEDSESSPVIETKKIIVETNNPKPAEKKEPTERDRYRQSLIEKIKKGNNMSESNENLSQSAFFHEGSTDLDFSKIVPEEKRAENQRGELLGTLATGQKVYDQPPEKSHLRDHENIRYVVEDALGKTAWRADIPTDKYTPFRVEFENSLGKSEVVSVPVREGIEIVYAPRLDNQGKPRMKADGSGPLYSRWVKGITSEEIPDCHTLKMIQTEPERWVKLITAFPTAGDPPQEAGGSWDRFPAAKNPALAYWENIGADGNPIDQGIQGHAFIYDESKLDTSNILSECPYDKTPNLVQ